LKKVEEYLQHAKECREMASRAGGEQKRQLENMAATWEQLAEGRKRQLVKQLTPGKVAGR
jgi:hypothetical protein